MLHRTGLRLLTIAALSAGVLIAGEYAVFDTGFRLRVERHERVGNLVRLITAEGAVELPAEAITRFEADDYIAPRQPPQQQQEPPPSLDELVESAAARQGLPPALVHSVIHAESAYDPLAVSPKGAVGLMQLMPQTARELAVADRTDPEQNVRGGTAYLKQMLDRFSGSNDYLVRALAAYNAGPEAVERHNGLPPYMETRQFVKRVLRRFLSLTENPPDE